MEPPTFAEHPTNMVHPSPAPSPFRSSLDTGSVVVVAIVAIAAIAALMGCGGDEERAIEPPRTTDTPAAEEGPWLVHRVELGDGHFVLVPSTSTSATEPALGPLPIVLFTPGFSAQPSDYEDTLRHVASHGFAVVAADHGFSIGSSLVCQTQRDGFEHAQRALAEARRRGRVKDDALFGLITEGRLATMGHSYGGKLALWLASESAPAVDAAMALDPVDGGDDRRPGYCGDDDDGFPQLLAALPTTTMPPTLIVMAGLSGDCAPAEGNGDVLFAALPSSTRATLLRLPRATHTDFIDDVADGECAACGLCPPSQESGAAVLRLVRATAVSFLRYRLLDDDRDARWVENDAVMGDDVESEVLERR